MAMRGRSAASVLSMRLSTYPFDGVWAANFGSPEKGGTWIIWGESASGKSTFVMQLAKYMSRYAKVGYWPYEEGVASVSLQRRMELCNMCEAGNRLTIYEPVPIDRLAAELSGLRSSVWIFDSLQAMGLRYRDYDMLRRKYPRKTMIFVSQAERREPKNACARAIKYDAGVKIYVSGYAATCMGRYMPAPGTHYVIWREGRAKMLNLKTDNHDTDNQ